MSTTLPSSDATCLDPEVFHRFRLLAAKWEALAEQHRQTLMDVWSLALTGAGLPESESDNASIDLPVIRMMYGYALGRGFRPTLARIPC